MANAASFKTTIRISPEQIEIGDLLHDNRWPDETAPKKTKTQEGIRAVQRYGTRCARRGLVRLGRTV